MNVLLTSFADEPTLELPSLSMLCATPPPREPSIAKTEGEPIAAPPLPSRDAVPPSSSLAPATDAVVLGLPRVDGANRADVVERCKEMQREESSRRAGDEGGRRDRERRRRRNEAWVLVAGEEVPGMLTKAAKQVAATWPFVSICVCPETPSPHVFALRRDRVVFDAPSKELGRLTCVQDACRLVHRACAAASLPNTLLDEGFDRLPLGASVLVVDLDRVGPHDVARVAERQARRMLFVAPVQHEDVRKRGGVAGQTLVAAPS